jgi:hypothetical protein
MITKDYDKNNTTIDKTNILFINAETSYIKDGLTGAGFKSVSPYRYKTLIGRVILEICVRLYLPHNFLFNKKDILHFDGEYIIVYDSIVTRRFIVWLIKNKRQCRIIYLYTNLVGKARNLTPAQIPQSVSIWTYDSTDAEKYHINLVKCGGYSTCYIGDNCKKKYDVVYIGRDKGRAEYLLSLEKKLNDVGLKTKFLIMPDTRIAKKKQIYSKAISYFEVIKLVTESRAVVNIVLPGQTGVSLRDYESLFNQVKLITNNPVLKLYNFYDPANIFILGDREISEIPSFINSPYKKIKDEILASCTLSAQITEILSNVNTVNHSW